MKLRPLSLLIVLLVAGFSVALCVFPLNSTDIWWHLRTGAEIVRTGELPRTDWYTYTDGGRAWIDLHWGFQLLVHALYQLGGIDLLILAKAGITTVAVLVMWRASGREVSIAAAAPLVALVAIVVSGQAIVRPKMLTLVALALFLLISERGETRPKVLFALIPLQIVWTNVQGLFVLGPVVLACFIVDRCARRLRSGGSGVSASLRFDLLVFVAVLLACLVNPYGLDGALFPLELWKKFTVDQEVYSIVLAFQQPIDFIEANGFLYAYMLFEVALVVVAAFSFLLGLRRGRVSVFRALLFAAFAMLAWKAIRNADLFAIVAGFVVLGNLGRTGAERERREALAGGGRPGTARSLATLALLSVLLGTTLSGDLYSLAGDGRRLGLGEREDWYMHGPARFASAPSMPAGAFVRHNGQAAVYIFETGPGRKVFMDARLEVSTKQTLATFHEVSRRMAAGDASFEDLVRMPNGKLPAVLLDSLYSREQIDGMLRLRSRWRLVFQDRSGVVFLDEATAERAGLPDLFD